MPMHALHLMMGQGSCTSRQQACSGRINSDMFNVLGGGGGGRLGPNRQTCLGCVVSQVTAIPYFITVVRVYLVHYASEHFCS